MKASILNFNVKFKKEKLIQNWPRFGKISVHEFRNK